MPPGKLSRHMFAFGIRDPSDGAQRTFLTDRVPFPFQSLPDNIQHVVVDGDTLWNLASRFYSPVERPAGLFWVIADFQPDPIHDPTVRLEAGKVLILPSLRTVMEKLFSPSRRDLTA